MSHPFGDLLSQHLHRQHGLSQAKLAAGILQDPSIITAMCKGQRLSGPQARERVIAMVHWLREQGVLQTVAEANALLDAAGMASLREREPADALLLQQFGPSVALQYQAPRARTNLPAPLTSFVGREREMAEVLRLMAEHRLVTLMGAGGVGKTRLAVEVGMNLVGTDSTDLADGVWLVEFAPLTDATLVPQFILHVFGLSDPAGRAPLDLLQDYLADKRMLLILDNCEHLVDACARVTEQLLQRCWHVRVLATSRESLRVPGERTYHVPSLDTPEPPELSVARLLECPSARLFVERVRALRPQFMVQADNVAPLAQICNHLNGIPLALELAAPLTATMALDEMAAQLGHHLALLVNQYRTATPRHRTMRSALDWSYNLLSPTEQRLLVRLSVFAGGWTAEAAEWLYGSPDALDLLAQLVSKSLVVIDESAGEPRYMMLETIRQYGQDKLAETGEGEQAHRSHLELVLSWVKEAEPHLTGIPSATTTAWCDRLESEIDNLRAVLNWVMQTHDISAGQRLINGLQYFWSQRGYNAEGMWWIDALLLSDAAISTAARVRGMNAKATLAYFMGDNIRAEAIAREALPLAYQLEDEELILRAEHWVGALSSDYAESVRLLNHCIRTAQRAGWALAYTTSSFMLAQRTWIQGDLDGATALFNDHLARVRKQDNANGIASTYSRLGKIALQRGHHSEAREALEEAVAAARRGGLRTFAANAMIDLAALSVREGDLAQASEQVRECISEFYRVGIIGRIGGCLSVAAGIAQLRSDLPLAARLLGKAAAIRRDYATHGILEFEVYREYEYRMPLVRTAMEPAAFDYAFAEGQQMPLHQAVEYVLVG
jgi:non-specific serine/threonine protein kinase